MFSFFLFFSFPTLLQFLLQCVLPVRSDEDGRWRRRWWSFLLAWPVAWWERERRRWGRKSVAPAFLCACFFLLLSLLFQISRSFNSPFFFFFTPFSLRGRKKMLVNVFDSLIQSHIFSFLFLFIFLFLPPFSILFLFILFLELGFHCHPSHSHTHLGDSAFRCVSVVYIILCMNWFVTVYL